MLLLCDIFRILEVIDRFITSRFRRCCNQGKAWHMRNLENSVGGVLQKQLFLVQ